MMILFVTLSFLLYSSLMLIFTPFCSIFRHVSDTDYFFSLYILHVSLSLWLRNNGPPDANHVNNCKLNIWRTAIICHKFCSCNLSGGIVNYKRDCLSYQKKEGLFVFPCGVNLFKFHFSNYQIIIFLNKNKNESTKIYHIRRMKSTTQVWCLN